MKTTHSLAVYGGPRTIPEGVTHPEWPVITREYEDAVIKQLHESVSIYNRSGIIEEFEDQFAALHGAKYALLNNSGTNSIWTMLVAAGLRPGDEVLCPTYTFFATNTPLLSSGLAPVFCDADENGGLGPRELQRRLTPKTKAIIVTHMWGYPCDMDAITAFARRHDLLLFEDCSHAHLAMYKGKLVGTFGNAAVWSLQGQKNITGGEGGILLTNNKELYIRANLHGHYNKRCKQEIPMDHDLYRFATTGMGLKMRSHPLAVIIAKTQLDNHKKYQRMRKHCAQRYEELFAEYDFIETLKYADNEPSWYAFVFKFDEAKTKFSRAELVEMLQAEGLQEVDIPGSTGPNHLLPIFKESHVLFPHFYTEKEKFNTDAQFPGATAFYNTIVKLPTWTLAAHEEILDYYIKGLRKVLDYVKSTDA